MPPRLFLNFGIPPTKSPPSWGADSMPDVVVPSLLPWSLLLLALFPGIGGARPPGGLGMPPKPGIGGAPPIGGPAAPPPVVLPTAGAERSLVTVFFRALPLLMSWRRAPYERKQSVQGEWYYIKASVRRIITYSTGTSGWFCIPGWCCTWWRRRWWWRSSHARHGRRWRGWRRHFQTRALDLFFSWFLGSELGGCPQD